MIEDGVGYSYGILIEPLRLHFQTTRSIMAFGGSLMIGSYCVSSIGAGIFINKYGCRKVCIAGCLIAAFGIGISQFSPNTLVFMISYGLIGGCGLGTMYIASMIVISHYFDKKVTKATVFKLVHSVKMS